MIGLILTLMIGDNATPQDAWRMQETTLSTKWADQVDVNNVLPEYPRPQMTRPKWTNLNGLWEYAVTTRTAEGMMDADGQILVPFPIESALSGVKRRVTHDDAVWYRRHFRAVQPEDGHRLLLHFGAVDYDATVYVNHRQVAHHKGGFTPFSVDITDYLRDGDDQMISVRVYDPTDFGGQPRGKQTSNPEHIWYTPVSGIWQTVWTEVVPPAYIEGLKITPDVDQGIVRITVNTVGDTEGMIVTLSHGDFKASGHPNKEITVPVEQPILWTPDNPHLYDLRVTLDAGSDTIDRVGSYFAMRKVDFAPDASGHLRLRLNNEPVFMFGPLDQGWWPDGLYTAPTDEALKWDVEFTKRLGLNMARKHIKVEPARWYYWCDKLGLMVWQDFPSGGQRGTRDHIGNGGDDAAMPGERKQMLRQEWKTIMDTLHNYPSIVAWVPFNEGWTQFETNSVIQWTMDYDPSRLVDGPSGWTDKGLGHMIDRHDYPGPSIPDNAPGRVRVLGEFGGLGLPVENHLWWTDRRNWGYRTYETKAQLQEEYGKLMAQLPALIDQGLSAAIYTQTTDVEGEVNGYATYDRRVEKFDMDWIYKQNQAIINRLAK